MTATGPHPTLVLPSTAHHDCCLCVLFAHAKQGTVGNQKIKASTSGGLFIFLVTYSGFSVEAQGHGLFLRPSQKSNLLLKNLFRTHNYN